MSVAGASIADHRRSVAARRRTTTTDDLSRGAAPTVYPDVRSVAATRRNLRRVDTPAPELPALETTEENQMIIEIFKHKKYAINFH